MSRTAILWNRGLSLPAPMRESTHWTPLRDLTDLLALGCFARNLYVGGSDVLGIPAEVTGDVELPGWFPFLIDNSNSQISGFSNSNGGTLVVQVRYFVRVSNGAITFTPKIVYGTSMSALSTTATISGQAACSATSSAYTGTDQVQTVAFTLPAGAKWFKALGTIGGTPAAGYQAFARAVHDLYISS